jgi:hypothetical protein
MFRLADIIILYKQRLDQLRVEKPDVNSTRLKENPLAEIPGLEARKQGRDVILAFQKDIQLILSEASDYSDAIALAKAAKVLRKHMLQHKSAFDETFYEGCVEDAVPPTVVFFSL